MQGGSTLEISLDKITENAARVVALCQARDIAVLGVTKGFSAIRQIAAAIVEGGVEGLADARMENIIELRNQNFNHPITLLRIPRLSNVDTVVKYADISMNSEFAVMKALSEAAVCCGKIHKIILMVDVGDLREGVLQENVLSMVRWVLKLAGLSLIGLGTNMGCFGGVLPSCENLGCLVELTRLIERQFAHKLEIVSGGGTSTLLLVENNTIPQGINQLRVGEGILLGTDTTNNRQIPWLQQDAFRLRAEVIEVKDKPSVPVGEIGQDAFGNVPEFEDTGIRKRAILAFGRQEVDVDGIYPLDQHLVILGASSDHTIVDISDSAQPVRVGDAICFGLRYSGLLSASSSRYVGKLFKRGFEDGN